MEHLSHKSRSSVFLFGIGMLMLFFFCAPMRANNPAFKSTSSYKVASPNYSATKVNPNSIGHQTYRSTIYTPFGNGTPSSNNPSGNSGSGGSGDPNDDVGIPGWADTPSEPLPIGDTAPLFLFAAAMIAIIWIRQRRKLQTTPQTSNTTNNDTNEMTLTQHTRKSFRKFLMLALLLCVVGEASADGVPSKIYFRPSTTNFAHGYTNQTTIGKGKTEASGFSDVYWTKNSYITVQVCKGSITGGSFTLWDNVIKTTSPSNRFIEMDVPSGYNGVIAYRLGQFTAVESLYTSWKNGGGKSATYTYNSKNYDIYNYNTIPKFADSNGDRPSSPEPIPTDGRNLLCNKEGWWDVWYWAYYLPTTNDVKIYFAKVDNWEGRTDVKFLTGKDIYTYETTATTQTIEHTKLAYFSLNGSEFGYLDYGFIGGTNSWSSSKTIPSVGGTESNWVYDTSSSFDNNKTDAAKNSNSNQNRIANRRTYSAYYTKTLSNLLSGYNLFIPGKANKDASLTKQALTDYQSLNHTQTIKVVGGGKINYYTHKLSSANATSREQGTDQTGTVTFEAAYTATVSLRAIPDNGCAFIGFFEEGSSTPLAAVADKENAGQYTYSYSAPNGTPKTITAVFTDKNKIRSQTLIYNESEAKYEWKNSNIGGNISQLSYTNAEGNSVTLSNIDNDPNDSDGFVHKNDVNRDKTLQLTAAAKTGYTFIGWWNNTKGPYTDNPWQMIPKNQDEPITARFAPSRQQTISVHTYDKEQDKYVLSGNGGSISMSYSKIIIGSGYGDATETVTTQDTYTALYNTSVTLTATPKSGYAFLGWYEGENKVGSNTTYTYTATTDRNITARFHQPFSQIFDVQTEISGQYQNSTAGGTATITYNDATTNLTDQKLSLPFEQGTMVELNATPKDGYRFVGWFQNDGTCWTENPYTYRAEGARTLHARFARNDVQLVVAVMNYNTDYADFVEYPHDNNTVTISNGGNTTTVTSSTSAVINYGTQVTLTATPDPHQTEGYDFIGWYQNNKRISTSKTYTFTITDHSAISAHFAPKQCHKVILYHTLGGQYQVKYAREELFNSESDYYVATSLFDKDTTIFVPYNAKLTVIESTVKPICGYAYKGYRAIQTGGGLQTDGTYIINPAMTDGVKNVPQVFPGFVRTEEQVVYLDLSSPNLRNDWANKEEYFICVRYLATSPTIVDTIQLQQVKDKLYTTTIAGDKYSDVTFYYEGTNNEGKFSRISTTPQAIPATRNNCFILNGVYSSTDGWIDGWTKLDTENEDYRLIYIEQEVASKTKIDTTYIFDEGDRIKKVSSGTKTDIVSLHIYNKVSKDNNGNLTGTALNNPEIILQQWSESAKQWVDVERHMVFGPLQTDNTDHIRMPGRKNTTPDVVIDRGIDAIKAQKEDATEDYGSGVWNFYITQEDGNVKLELDKTEKYTGKYYIRTTNADGQYNNFTHPNNEMTFSEYAKKNSDFSHYFVRYIDIYEDGTPTATAGKHPVVKFTIANEHAMFLCKEFLIDNNRFTDDEYGDDLYVKNVGGAPNLPADATVRFGWDIVTNRLTRAYIANTDFKNNEYLVVEGTNITDISGNTLQAQDEATYFNENGDFFYQIDVKAKVGATANVKAKYNGKYQYFMGSEGKQAPLLSGSGSGTYPVRILYDFKNDRFMTFCELEGNINGTVALNTSVMIMREHNDPPTRLTFDANASVTATTTNEDQYTKPAYAVMTFLEDKLLDNNVSKYEKMFYWISFPFDVKISDVFGLGDYGKYWIMEEYDGKQRSENGLAQTNWKYITKKSHDLKQNVGYVLCLNYSQILQDQLFKSHGAGEFGHSKLSLYFPSNSVISPAMLKGGQTVKRKLEQMESNATAWNHHNWHLIGVPSFATPGFDSKQDDIAFLYQYWHPGDAYAAVTPNDVTFHAMHSFMVQYYGDITWTSVVNTGTPLSIAAKKDADADKKVMLRLELQQAGSTIDKTYVQLRNDKGTKGFDMSLDLTKIINAGANIYSIVNNHEMAGNALPKEETVLPLGVVITAAGEYTFAMPQGTEGMIVELIDYEQGTCTNLLVGDYTVNMPVGTNNTRFALRLVPDKVATSVEDITSGTDDNVRKLLIDGVLYLVKDGAVYDAQGKLVK